MDSQSQPDSLSPEAQRELALLRQLRDDPSFNELFLQPLRESTAQALDALRDYRTDGVELIRLHQEWVTLANITDRLDKNLEILESQETAVKEANQ